MFRMFEHKRGEVTGGWTELHDEEFCNLYACSTRMIKSCRVRWVRRVASMGEVKNAYINLVRTPEERVCLEDLDRGRILLKLLLKVWC
jgi:hypothetical protein